MWYSKNWASRLHDIVCRGVNNIHKSLLRLFYPGYDIYEEKLDTEQYEQLESKELIDTLAMLEEHQRCFHQGDVQNQQTDTRNEEDLSMSESRKYVRQ